jgi:APA family basic amino acid/polyamine antiporter
MASAQLERKLGLWACISIVAGAIIGSSIFMKPATMASQLGSPILLLSVWIIAGAISIFGGMINSELGTLFPQTGGQYVYYRHMYGRFFAFVYGWSSFIVINTASMAGIAFLFAQYSEYFHHLPRFSEATERSVSFSIPFIGSFYPLQNIGQKGLALLLVFGVTVVNIISVRMGAAIQVFFTIVKIAALLLLVGGIFFSGKGDVNNFIRPASSVANYSIWNYITGFVAAASGALAAYDGWNVLGYVAGEVKDPRRNLPRGVLMGISICIAMYLLTNLAYLYMIPAEEMQHSSLVASDAFQKVVGMAGGGLIAAMVMISTLGATNGNFLPCARVPFAMAEEGSFFQSIAKVHPQYKTPVNALWLQFILVALFIITGSFDALMDMFVFMSWVYYGFLGYGLILLRHKMPEAERSYKVWAYPYVPIIFIGFSVFYFVLTIYNDVSNYITGKSPVINSLLGLLLTATGIPLYFYFGKKR